MQEAYCFLILLNPSIVTSCHLPLDSPNVVVDVQSGHAAGGDDDDDADDDDVAAVAVPPLSTAIGRSRRPSCCHLPFYCWLMMMASNRKCQASGIGWRGGTK